MRIDTKALEVRGGTEPVPLDAHAAARQSAAPPPVATGSSEELTLRGFVRTLGEGRGIVLACIALGAIAGVAYLAAVRPIYHADALLQVEEKKSSSLGLQELSNVFGIASPAETETEILRSRMLVGAVIKELRLDLVATPHYFPVVGEPLALRRPQDQLAPPLLGGSSFAWGGERIEVTQLEVPARWEGKALTLVALGHGAYELRDPDGAVVGAGEAGKPLVAGETRLVVSKLVARDQTRFDLRKIPIATAIEQLRKDLLVSEKGKSTGLIEIGLERTDPALACAVLDALARTYVRQNVELRSAEAQKTLDFINSQLPQLKQNAEKAEQALNAYRKSRRAGVDFGAETRASLDRAASIERMLTEIELQGSEIKQRYTANHPAYQALASKGAQLREERAALDREMQRLPETELHLVQLTRDAKVASELYVLLLNKSQELSVVKSGTVGNVRILDAALAAPEPVSPRRAATMALSIGLGLVAGMGLVFARKALDEGMDDPEVIERHTGLPVFATIPHSPIQSGKGRQDGIVLAAAQPSELAVEAVRSLRTSVLLGLAGARNNVVAIMGPSPGVGKTFVSVNLAHVLADAGHRVLLVDADLRKGTLHHHLGTARSPGLADLLHGTDHVWEVQTVSPGLHFVPCGEPPANPSELLSSRRFDKFLETASPDYDVVLIDTAPVLAVTDGVLAARKAATTLLVLRAGQHPLREIASALKQMAQNGVQPTALVLNDLRAQAADYSYVRYGQEYRAHARPGANPSRRS